jgi:hypothetical protein
MKLPYYIVDIIPTRSEPPFSFLKSVSGYPHLDAPPMRP